CRHRIVVERGRPHAVLSGLLQDMQRSSSPQVVVCLVTAPLSGQRRAACTRCAQVTLSFAISIARSVLDLLLTSRHSGSSNHHCPVAVSRTLGGTGLGPVAPSVFLTSGARRSPLQRRQLPTPDPFRRRRFLAGQECRPCKLRNISAERGTRRHCRNVR